MLIWILFLFNLSFLTWWFRRISELREQCSLEQQAKQPLEEEFRAELEEKQHIIAALNTKVNRGSGGPKG